MDQLKYRTDIAIFWNTDTEYRTDLKKYRQKYRIPMPTLNTYTDPWLLRISGHLPAAIVNGGGDRFWKWKEFKLQGLVTLTLTLDPAIRHTVVHHIYIDLYLYTKFHSNRRNFLWTDGRTDGRTYVRTFSPSNIIRSSFGSRPKKWRTRRTLRIGTSQSDD